MNLDQAMKTFESMLVNVTENDDAGICFLEELPGRQKLSIVYKLWNIRSQIDKALKKLSIRRTEFSYPYAVY